MTQFLKINDSHIISTHAIKEIFVTKWVKEGVFKDKKTDIKCVKVVMHNDKSGNKYDICNNTVYVYKEGSKEFNNVVSFIKSIKPNYPGYNNCEECEECSEFTDKYTEKCSPDCKFSIKKDKLNDK